MVKVGIIGFGLAARVFHLPVLTRVKGFKVTSVYSSKDEAEIHQVLPGVKIYRDIDDFFQTADTDLVLVLTPNDLHFDLATKALEAGKHLVIDKPFVCNQIEGQQLIELAQAKQKLLTVYHNRRWDGDFLTLKKLIEQGTLSKPTYFESRFDKYRPKIWGRWREQDRPGAGLLFDLGSHLIDQALYLFGDPDTVYAKVHRQRPKAAAADYFQITLGYADTDVVLRGSSLAAVTPFRYYLEADNGVFQKTGQDVQEKQMAENMSPYNEYWGLDDPSDYGTLHLLDTNEAKRVTTERGCYQTFYENLLQACQGKEQELITAEEALKVVKVIELAMQSSQDGKELNFNV